MNFEQAWTEMIERIADKEIESGEPEIEICFSTESDESGRATLVAPRFHKYTDEAKDDVKRAWETYCRLKPDNKIECINLLYKKTA